MPGVENTGLIAIMGAALGGCLTFAGVFWNARTQYKTTGLKTVADRDLDQRRRDEAARTARDDLRRAKVESLYKSVVEVEIVCSLTQVQLEREKGYSLIEYEKRWNELRSGLLSAVADTAIYFPAMIDDVQTLSRQVESFRFEVLYFLQVDHTDPSQLDNWNTRYLSIMRSVKTIQSNTSDIKREITKIVQAESLAASRQICA